MGKFLLGHFGIIALLLLATQNCASNAHKAEITTIAGTIRITGNEPFTHVVLTPGDDWEKTPRDQEYLLIGPLTDELRRKYQSKKIKLEGVNCPSPSPEFVRCFRPSRILAIPQKTE